MPVPPTETSLTWRSGTYFEAESVGGDPLAIDMPLAKGGTGAGFSPMTLLLHAVAGCMAVTVAQILEKQRAELQEYRLTVRGERAPDPPSPFTRIVVEHRFRGPGLTRSNLERLVTMVEERYCSVAATLPHGLIENRIVLLGAEEKLDEPAPGVMSA